MNEFAIFVESVLLRTFDEYKEAIAIVLLDDIPPEAVNDVIDPHSKKGWKMIHFACAQNLPLFLAKLLAIPGIDVNARDHYWNTALHYCVSPECLKLLLESAKTDLLARNSEGMTGLRVICLNGNIQCVKMILAGLHTVSDFDLSVARSPTDTELDILVLLSHYINDRYRTRRKLRIELKLDHYDVVSLFILIVLLCDDYFTLSPSKEFQKERKFFLLAQKLPLEVQMVLCNRAFGQAKNTISPTLFEKALRIFKKDHWLFSVK